MGETDEQSGKEQVYERKSPKRLPPKELGHTGEDIACNYLMAKGYTLLARNWHLGRASEIDLVFKGQGVLSDLFIFVEVKTRYREDYFGFYDMGFNAVYRTKQQKVINAALVFLARQGLSEAPSRFDVVVVEYPKPSDSLMLSRPPEPVVIHVEDAF